METIPNKKDLSIVGECLITLREGLCESRCGFRQGFDKRVKLGCLFVKIFRFSLVVLYRPRVVWGVTSGSPSDRGLSGASKRLCVPSKIELLL